MADMKIILNDTFVSRELEDWEIDALKNSNIEDFGVKIYPVNAATSQELGFEIPFRYKTLQKKGAVYEGSLDINNKRYILKINAEMKVKLRSGVTNFLNEEDGGYSMKFGCIAYEPNDGYHVMMTLSCQESIGQFGPVAKDWVAVRDYTIN
jgi:hypothetical protein